MRIDDFENSIAPLRDLGGQRVWSLMISLFGDLAQDQDDVIDGPVLSTIMARLAVKPEAVRVALHRLRNDDWITSRKSGRISRHSLTAKGRRESARASPRIYAAPPDAAEKWQVVVLEEADMPPTAELTDAGFSQIMARVFVGPATALAPPGALCLAGGQAPHWLWQQALPRTLEQDYAALLTTLTDFAARVPDADRLSVLDRAVVRCLIVHNWRRLALRHPRLPGALMSDESPATKCHKLVATLLDRFQKPRLCDIEALRVAA